MLSMILLHVTNYEIGDSKMDTGLKYVGLAKQLSGVEYPSDALQTSQFIDLLVAREMSWHRGPVLIQNVLSCIFVESQLRSLDHLNEQDSFHRSVPQSIQSWKDVLELYIFGLVKCISMSGKILASGGAIYPEEDVTYDTYDLPFLENVSISSVLKELRRAAQWISSRSENSQPGLDALKVRFQLRISILEILELFEDFKPSSIPTIENICNDALKSIHSVTLNPIESTSKFDLAFSQSIQARVTNMNPLRPLECLSFSVAYNDLRQVIESIINFLSVFKLKHSTDVLSLFLSFSSKHPRPLAIVRSLLCRAAINPEKQELLGMPLREWVIKDLCELTCPSFSQVFHSTNPHISAALDQFLEQAVLSYGDLVVVFCQNRSRQRRNLAHCILTWDSLQVELETRLESHMNTPELILPDGTSTSAFVISSWVYLRKLQIMMWVTLMGFELDIYKMWEYSRMYWYAQYVVTHLINHLSRLSTFHSQSYRKSKLKYRSQIQFSLSFISALETEAAAISKLCVSSMLISHSLDLAGLIPHPVTQFTTAELLFNLRLKAFSSVGIPELPTLRTFSEAFSETSLADWFPVEKLPVEFKSKKSNIPRSLEISLALSAAKLSSSSALSVISDLSRNVTVGSELDLIKRSSVGLLVTCTVGLRLVLSAMKENNGLNCKIQLKREEYHWFFPVLTISSE